MTSTTLRMLAVPFLLLFSARAAAQESVTVTVYHLCDQDALADPVAWCPDGIGGRRYADQYAADAGQSWKCDQAADRAMYVDNPPVVPPRGNANAYDFDSLNYGCNAHPEVYPYAVNPVTLPADTYLQDVLPAETSPGLFPLLTMQKAQAVAARSYALRKKYHPDPNRGFDNTTANQVFIPGSYDLQSATGQQLVTQALAQTSGQYLVSQNDFGQNNTGPDFAAFTEFCSDHAGDQTVAGSESYLASIYDPEGRYVAGVDPFSHQHGLSQVGACRWVDGNTYTPGTWTDCSWRGVAPGVVSTRPRWDDYRSILFHYYTGVQLVGGSACQTDRRWNPLSITARSAGRSATDWAAGQLGLLPVAVQAGAVESIEIDAKNSGTLPWSGDTSIVYWWVDSAGVSTTPLAVTRQMLNAPAGGHNLVTFNVYAPRTAGNYVLHLDMGQAPVKTPVDPFSAHCNLPDVRIPVVVSGSALAFGDTVLIIDSSGSMSWNDPQDRRKEASKAFVTLSPPSNTIGVVDFDDGASQLLALTSTANSGSIVAAIDRIDSFGGTNIGAGVSTGFGTLSGGSQTPRAAILLTDGDGTYANEHQQYVAKKWPIYTLGFGQANKTLLCQIARETGGDYNMGEACPTAAASTLSAGSRGNDTKPPQLTAATTATLTPESMVCAFQHIRSKLDGGPGSTCDRRSVSSGAGSLAFDVPAGQGYWSFTASWSAISSPLGGLTLVSPSGRRIDGATVAKDVAHGKGRTYEVFRLATPEDGRWTAQFTSQLSQAVVFGTAVASGDSGNRPQGVSAAAPSVATLWPPNHRPVGVEIKGVTDPDGDPFTITVTGVTQDEPVSGLGSGDTSPDADGVGTSQAHLLAERSGDGDGRVYRIHFTARDARGAAADGSVAVCAPHDRSTDACVDSGQGYDSTLP